MNLTHIERGTKLAIYEELQNRKVSDEHEAVLKYYEAERLLVIQCAWLHENFDRLKLGAKLNISYGNELSINSFTGLAKEKLRSSGLVMIEQLTNIETKSRRQFDRDELRVKVNVYGVPESKLSVMLFNASESKPDLSDITFDISSGGLCIISDTLLTSKYDPYYMVEFALTDKSIFILPAKVVRKSNYPRTKIGRYDYGFQFIFDKIPEEKARLTRAILSKKVLQR